MGITLERTVIILILVLSAIICIILFVTAWGRRKRIGQTVTCFSICVLAVAIYNFGYAMEVASNTLENVMFWVRFEHFGIQPLAATWFLFSMYLTGKEKWITPRRVALLYLIPLFMIASAQTLGSLNWLHDNPRLLYGGIFPTFTYDRGFLLYLDLVYEGILLGISSVLYSIMLLRAAPAFRKQAAIFWVGSMMPWIGSLLFNFGLAPYNLDLTPFALTTSILLFALGFLKFQLMDIVPFARDVIFEGMNDAVLVLDTQNRLIDYNDRTQTVLPEVEKSAIGKPIGSVLSSHVTLLDLIRGASPENVEMEIENGSNSNWYRCSIVPIFDRQKSKVGKIITMHDYTQTKQLLEQLELLATQDSLTGVYNRRYFNQMISQELYRYERYGGTLSLIMLDLDYFKKINDTYGHAAGDVVLQKAADICHHTLRQTDMIGRYGGEEFVILLPETDADGAAIMAERLRTAIEELDVRYDGNPIYMTASFGVVSKVSPEKTTLDDLYRCADQAVYQAKDEGRNRVRVYTPVE